MSFDGAGGARSLGLDGAGKTSCCGILAGETRADSGSSVSSRVSQRLTTRRNRGDRVAFGARTQHHASPRHDQSLRTLLGCSASPARWLPGRRHPSGARRPSSRSRSSSPTEEPALLDEPTTTSIRHPNRDRERSGTPGANGERPSTNRVVKRARNECWCADGASTTGRGPSRSRALA